MPFLTHRFVTLLGLPTLMEDLVRKACDADGEIEVGRSVADMAQLREEFMTHEVNVVIAATSRAGELAIPQAVFALQPQARVLLIEPDEAAGDVFELRPRLSRLGPLSPQDVVRAVCDDADHAKAWCALGAAKTEGGA